MVAFLELFKNMF